MPAPDDFPHVLIADVAVPLPPGQAQPPLPAQAALPNLHALLALAQGIDTVALDDDSLATPLEVALARALGLPDAPGTTPWAAFDTNTTGRPCAWLQPCHWQLGMDDVRLIDPTELALTEPESRALLAAVQPLLHSDGIALRYERPDAWLAQGELLHGLRCASVQRALQQPITRQQLALADHPAARAHWLRLHSEIQMLLYTHPVNDARVQARRWPVNAVWVAGAGSLAAPVPPRPQVQVASQLQRLRDATAADWAEAWRAIDRDALAPLLATVRAGGSARLSLCGPRRALTLLCTAGRSPWQWITSKIRPLSLPRLREQL